MLWVYQFRVYEFFSYQRDQGKDILRKFEPVLGKLVSSIFDKKRMIPLYIIQCSNQALRYNIVYINENLTLVGTWSKNYIFPWQSAVDIHSKICVGFWKTTQTSGLYNCQLEKLIAWLYGSWQREEYKNINLVAPPSGNRDKKEDEGYQFGSKCNSTKPMFIFIDKLLFHTGNIVKLQ